jgi:hypothetical protein
VVAALLAVEAAIRVHAFGLAALLHPLRYTDRSLGELGAFVPSDDPELVIAFRPGVDTTFKGARFTTNRHGARGPEVTLDKPPGVRRIAVLGTSIELGQGVSDDDVFSRRLERALDRDEPGRYQVENFGMPAYDVFQQARLYETRVRPLSPDVVLYGVYPPDLAERPSPRRLPGFALPSPFDLRGYGSYTLGYGVLRKVWSKGGAVEDWQARVRQRWSELDDDDRAGAQRRLGQGAAAASQGAQDPPALAPRAPREELEAFVRARRAEGTLVVLLRLRTNLFSRVQAFGMGSAMEALCARAGCAVVDTYRALEGKIGPDDVVGGADAHPNARVHGLYADAVHEQLVPILAKLKRAPP